jgi:hypothetical protein
MKQPMARYAVIGACLSALLCMVALYARAQQPKEQTPAHTYAGGKATSKALPDGGPAPRLADGHPDLSGIWFVGSLGKEDALSVESAAQQGDPNLKAFDPKVTPEAKPSLQPWAAEKIKQMGRGPNAGSLAKLSKEEQIAAMDAEITRLEHNCMPHGVPGMGIYGGIHGMQLVSTPGLVVQLTETNHDWRVIPTDGRAHKKDPDPLFNGDEAGRWEGDTLVVDTIAIDERTWNDPNGWFHSDQEHVVERFSRPSRNYLIYQVTVEDPKVLAKPWVSAPHKFSLSADSEPLNEWYCGINPDGDEEIRNLRESRQKLTDEIKKQAAH